MIAIPDSCFDGREYIVLNSDFLTQVADERTLLYSLNKPYATEVADKISDFNDLISTYGRATPPRRGPVVFHNPLISATGIARCRKNPTPYIIPWMGNVTKKALRQLLQGFLQICREDYSGWIASCGQTLAQEPQSTHSSALMV